MEGGDKMEDFKDFDINLYEDVDYEGNGDATTYSSWIGGNSLAEQNAQNLAQQQLLEEKIAEEEARSKELDEYSEYMKTDEFAEWYAKYYG